MPIHFRCPHCDKLLALGTRKAGTKIHCPMCAQLVTVPPRTEVQLPTSTVVPADLAQAWWMDAPAIEPVKPETPTESPPPPPAADAWWLTASSSAPVAADNPIPDAPRPAVPPPLPERTAPAAAPEPPNDLLFLPAPEQSADVPTKRTMARSVNYSRQILIWSAVLFAIFAVIGILLVVLTLLWPRPEERRPVSSRPADKAALSPLAEPKKPSTSLETKQPPSTGKLMVKYRREATEEALRREVAQFPEVSLDRGNDRTETQRIRLQSVAAARDGKPLDIGPQVMRQRADLAGLPIRKGNWQLDAAAAAHLQRGSLALRARLFAAREPGASLFAGAEAKKWLTPEGIPALQQLLMGENESLRAALVDQLARIDGKQASIALAQRALFDLHADVRRSALTALAQRPRADYQQVLLDGFRYPWSAVADHAAESLVALGMRETVPALRTLLDQPNPCAPYKKADKEERYVREVVRINHLHNCLLCHAPSLKESDKLRGFVPPTDRPLPPPFSREYYANRRPGSFVRADVTYLQQDFSVALSVPEPGKWPKMQRYDFLVRERLAVPADTDKPSEHRKALLFAVHELSD